MTEYQAETQKITQVDEDCFRVLNQDLKGLSKKNKQN